MFDEMFLYDNEQTAGNFSSDQDNEESIGLKSSLHNNLEFKERSVCIPRLMLMGLLYCSSNR